MTETKETIRIKTRHDNRGRMLDISQQELDRVKFQSQKAYESSKGNNNSINYLIIGVLIAVGIALAALII